MGDGEEEDG